MRFEEDASPGPRAAECARFFPLVLGAGIVGGKGESACATGGRCGARQDEDAAYCEYTGPRFPATTTWPAGLCSTTAVLFNGQELQYGKAVKRFYYYFRHRNMRGI